MRSMTRLPRKIEAAQNLVWRPLNQFSRVSLISRIPTATKMVRWCLNWCAEASQNVRVDAQTSIATILEFPTPRVRAAWVPPHARPCTVDDVEFYYLKLIQHLCNVTCRPLTLWPSDRYGPRWAGREAWGDVWPRANKMLWGRRRDDAVGSSLRSTPIDGAPYAEAPRR